MCAHLHACTFCSLDFISKKYAVLHFCTFCGSNLNIKRNTLVGQLHAVISVISVNRSPKYVHGYLWNYWDPVHYCTGDRPGCLGVVCIQESSYSFRTVTHQGESTLWPCVYQNMFIETQSLSEVPF